MSKYTEIRNEVKRLSAEQKTLKPLRKGEIPTSNSYYNEYPIQNKVISNKSELMHLFQAYSILKGKERSKVTKSHVNESYVLRLVEKYKNNLVTQV